MNGESTMEECVAARLASARAIACWWYDYMYGGIDRERLIGRLANRYGIDAARYLMRTMRSCIGMDARIRVCYRYLLTRR